MNYREYTFEDEFANQDSMVTVRPAVTNHPTLPKPAPLRQMEPNSPASPKRSSAKATYIALLKRAQENAETAYEAVTDAVEWLKIIDPHGVNYDRLVMGVGELLNSIGRRVELWEAERPVPEPITPISPLSMDLTTP